MGKIGRRSFLALGTAVAAAPFLPAATGKVDEDLAVFLSDIHVSAGTKGHYGKDLPKIVDRILALKPRPRTVVDFGDLACGTGELEAYRLARPQFERLWAAGIRTIHLMGNHDRRGNFRTVFPEAAKATLVPDRQVYELHFKHLDFLFLDTLGGDDNGTDQHPKPDLGDAQTAYLKNYLAAAKRPFMIGSHHQLGSFRFGKENLKDVLLKNPQCAGFVHGHLHTWSTEWFPSPHWKYLTSFHAVGLPSADCDGDIGFVLFRPLADRAVFKLDQWDFWFHRPVRAGEVAPPCWRQRVEDNMRGGGVTLVYDRRVPANVKI